MANFKEIFDQLNPEQQEAIEAHLLRTVHRVEENTKQRMKLVREVRAGPLRMEAVEFEGSVTFTMCFNNDVMAHMGQSSAEAFCQFVVDAVGDQRPRFVLVGDDSDHEYVIPEANRSDWEKIDFENDDLPSWARRIDGKFAFTEPIFGG